MLTPAFCITSYKGRIWRVCLAVMTDPFAPQVISIKADKYHTLSLQVSNAVVLEQATAYISLVTLHSTITKQQRYSLVLIAPAQ